MTTTDTIAALALAVAVVAAVAAFGSWRAAHNANGAAQTLSRGPPGLLSHNAIEITASLRNDNPHRGDGPQLAGTPTPEEVRAHIWGPWKFSADGRDDTGRTVAPQQLMIGEWTRYGLTPTSPPLWSATNVDEWHRDYANEPVRLCITVRSKGSEWIVPLEVPVTIEGTS
ncbi:hypothetical protein [Streptomyces sp. NPDC060002]|uniref:hypothetical protein n=1 Tax=Streptomyces sp. NPDC060002 TaxID=3347033 RepID=UPI0036A212C9